MGNTAEITGPDLTAGIDASQLAEGKTLVGHVGDQGVLLARGNGKIFAVGATCTHYGGPLGEGLVVGDTVRCPWHHACFDLRTGEASAPALSPVDCWRVEESAGRVVVRERLVRAPNATIKGAPESVVIVGAGAAGFAAAEVLRREGYGGAITMLGADAAGPVDRPNLSKDYLAGTAPEEWIPLRPDAYFDEHKIALRVATRATGINAEKRTVTLEGGEAVPFAALLLATGADPSRLPIPGADLPHVHVLRTLANSRAIIAAASTAKKVVVLGASFIGLETAASLRTRGLDVHVVGRESRPLENVLGPAVGDLVRSVHESHGVVFHLEQSPTKITATHVTLANGTQLEADLVVMGVGVRPAISLAEKAGLRTDRGVLVNEYMQTSVPGIYAAGDIARWTDERWGGSIRVEHWVVAQRQGQCAARNILGKKVPFRDVPFFWSNHYDLGIGYVGHAEKFDRVDIHGDLTARDAAIAYRAGERTFAVATIGRDHVGLEAEHAFERGDEAALRKLVPPRT